LKKPEIFAHGRAALNGCEHKNPASLSKFEHEKTRRRKGGDVAKRYKFPAIRKSRAND
jgi:hypothetical protein